MEQIWYNDILHLFTEKNFKKFFPSKDMTFAEQLNSLFRLSIYFSFVVYLLNKDTAIFMVPVCIALFTYFLYTIDTQNKIQESMYLRGKNLYKDQRADELCQKPTEHNPFMNVLMSDYAIDPERKKACNVSKSNVKKITKKYFDKNLYRSVSDIFNKEASDRQWITNPITTIPNDQDGFARWCYDTKKTCKEGNGDDCYKNIYRKISN